MSEQNETHDNQNKEPETPIEPSRTIIEPEEEYFIVGFENDRDSDEVDGSEEDQIEEKHDHNESEENS